MEEHTNLVNQGTVLMLNRVLKDLQVIRNTINRRGVQCMRSCLTAYADSRHCLLVP